MAPIHWENIFLLHHVPISTKPLAIFSIKFPVRFLTYPNQPHPQFVQGALGGGGKMAGELVDSPQAFF